MAILYTYPKKEFIEDNDLFIISDSRDENLTKSISYEAIYKVISKVWKADIKKELDEFRIESDSLYEPIGGGGGGASLFQYNASSFQPYVSSGSTPSVGAGKFAYALSVREGTVDIITFNFRINIVSLSDTSNIMRFENIPGTPFAFPNSAKWYGQVLVTDAPNLEQKATICEITGSNLQTMNFYRVDTNGDVVPCNWTGTNSITESMYIQGSITYVSNQAA